MKILILSCKFGMGHFSAAKSVQDKIIKEYKDIEVGSVDLSDYYMRTPKTFIKDFWEEIKNFTLLTTNEIEEYQIQEYKRKNETNKKEVKIVDLFELASPEYIDIIYKLFNIAIDKGGKLYNFIYKKADKNTILSNNKALELVYQHILGSITKLLFKEEPDVIISSFSICSEMISEYKKLSGSDIPLITVITDICPHKSWLNEETDYYLVATEETRQFLIENGVSEEKIVISGMPISEKFESIKNTPLKTTNSKKLLVMGGGLGLIPTDIEFYEELSKIDGATTTVITAKNKAMYDKLHGKFDNVEVLGFSDDVCSIMQNSDLIVSKSGGITTFESMYSKLPIAVFNPFLAQEVSNAEFIRDNKIGIVLPSKTKNVTNDIKYIKSLLEDDETLIKMRENMQKIINNIDEKGIIEILDKIFS